MADPDVVVRTRAMDEAPIGMVLTDPHRADNPMVYANEAFLDLTGYDREAVLGRNCRFLQGPATAAEPVATMREAIDAAEPVTVDVRNYRADGKLFWNRVAIAPVRDGGGTVTHFVGTQRDVTAEKRRARRLTEIRDRMEFALDATDSYIYEIDIGTGEETRHGPFERLHGIPSSAVGIAESEREYVFEPGYSTRQDGTGFGLNIVTEVVEAHGLSVRITDMRRAAHASSSPASKPSTRCLSQAFWWWRSQAGT
jgi:PAS domain S-box-containing protein